MLDWLGGQLSSIHRHLCIVLDRSSSGCSGMQGICAQWTGEGHMKCNGIQCIYASIDWEVHLPSIYMHCPRSSSGFSGMQDIYAWLTREGHMKCNDIQCIYASIDWEVHLPSIYMHCPRSISGFSGMQDIYAWLTREGHMKCNGIQGICAQLSGEGHMKCNGIQCIYAWLTRVSICLLYICIVLDPAVAVMVCMPSVLIDWGGPHEV